MLTIEHIMQTVTVTTTPKGDPLISAECINLAKKSNPIVRQRGTE